MTNSTLTLTPLFPFFSFHSHSFHLFVEICHLLCVTASLHYPSTPSLSTTLRSIFAPSSIVSVILSSFGGSLLCSLLLSDPWMTFTNTEGVIIMMISSFVLRYSPLCSLIGSPIGIQILNLFNGFSTLFAIGNGIQKAQKTLLLSNSPLLSHSFLGIPPCYFFFLLIGIVSGCGGTILKNGLNLPYETVPMTTTTTTWKERVDSSSVSQIIFRCFLVAFGYLFLHFGLNLNVFNGENPNEILFLFIFIGFTFMEINENFHFLIGGKPNGKSKSTRMAIRKSFPTDTKENGNPESETETEKEKSPSRITNRYRNTNRSLSSSRSHSIDDSLPLSQSDRQNQSHSSNGIEKRKKKNK